MTRVLFSLPLIALLAATAPGADTKYPLTGDNTKLTFVGTKPSGKHEGGFSKLNGTATVTDGNLATLKLEVDIDCDSLYSDSAKLTTHLKSPDFFGVKDNPKATFKTTKVEKADTLYSVTGDLTMLGKTKSVNFLAALTEKDGVLSMAAEFKIDRTQWGMTYGKGMVDNDVTVKVIMSAKK